MHIFTSHRDGTRRYLANFDLPTHPICWLRGHRANAEVVESKYGDPWVLVTCRTCGIRHSNPYLMSGSRLRDHDRAVEAIAAQVEAARNRNADYARVRDGRDGYGHRTLELSIELTDHSWFSPGVRLHIGDRWSETPFDGSLHGPRRSIYFSIGGVGNRLAERLTKGLKRDIRIGARHKEVTA